MGITRREMLAGTAALCAIPMAVRASESVVLYADLDDRAVTRAVGGGLLTRVRMPGGDNIYAPDIEVTSHVATTLADLPLNPGDRDVVLARQRRDASDAVLADLREHVSAVAAERPVVVVLVRRPLTVTFITRPPGYVYDLSWDADGKEVRHPVFDAHGNPVPIPGNVGWFAYTIVAIAGLTEMPVEINGVRSVSTREPDWMRPQVTG